jgi:hypothetical protein
MKSRVELPRAMASICYESIEPTDVSDTLDVYARVWKVRYWGFISAGVGDLIVLITPHYFLVT